MTLMSVCRQASMMFFDLAWVMTKDTIDMLW